MLQLIILLLSVSFRQKSKNIFISSVDFYTSKFVIFLPFHNRSEQQASAMDRTFSLRSGHVKDGELRTKKKKKKKGPKKK